MHYVIFIALVHECFGAVHCRYWAISALALEKVNMGMGL
jgi:hypothetical protein